MLIAKIRYKQLEGMRQCVTESVIVESLRDIMRASNPVCLNKTVRPVV